ncbi:MFS transporter [Paenibacillus sp. TH7-28]
MKHKHMLHEEKQYARLFTAGIVNGIGDRFSQVAVLGLLLSLTGSGLAVGITFAIRLIPYLLFGPLGGMLADRFSKKSIMIFTDIARFFFALTPLLVRHADDVWIIYVSSFVLSAGEALYAPARMSVIPRLVRRENLLAVNSLEQAMVGYVLIGGSVTGGFVSALIGGQASFVLNALTFLASALLLSGLDLSREPRRSTEARGSDASSGLSGGTFTEASAEPSPSIPEPQSPHPGALRQLLSRSLYLRLMIIVFAIWPLGDGTINILISVYAAEVFHMGEIGIGLLYGALGIGLVAGSKITGKIGRRMETVAIYALLLEGVSHMLISQSPVFVLALILMVGSAMVSSIGNACNETVLMKTVPVGWQGRFFGTLAALQNAIMGVSMLLAGFLLDFAAPRSLGLAAGILFTLLGAGTGIVWAVSPSRQARMPIKSEIEP